MFNQLLTTIMKKNLWMLAAALCMTACSQNEDIVIEQPVSDNDFESPDGRLIIQLGGIETRIGASVGVTRAPLDKLYDEAEGATTRLGIFALATNDATTNTAITDVNRAAAWGDTENYGILLNNIQAAVTAWPKQDGSDVKPDGLENDLAQKITLYKNNAANGVYYYPMQKKYDYSFYGYAPYQEGQTISAAKPEITFARFDGSQDIIWNNATAGEIAPNSIYLKKDIKNDASLTGYKAQYIRQLKYHHELNQAASEKLQDYPWIPNINFEHQLAQLRFSVIPATEQSEEDRTAVQNMKVKNITIKSHGTTATLNVLTGKLTFTDNGSLLMREATDDGKGNITFTDDNADGTVEVPKDIYVQKYEGGQYTLNGVSSANPLIQGYLMVKPDMEQFLMDVTIMAPDASGVPQDLIVRDIPVNAPTPAVDSGKNDNLFYAGYYYNVRIGIYATQQINATATLTTWKPGGDSVDVPIE